jgi:hypothetical protein
VLGVMFAAVPAVAGPRGEAKPILHEPIPSDPREDLALHVALEGNMPAALDTLSGVVAAPDPRAAPAPSEHAYGARPDAGFVPDRDTRRPDIGVYDEPFSPSIAPFKRMEAFDAVRSDYQLYVRDPRLVPVGIGGAVGPGDDAFFANLVIDLTPDRTVRIPSVGPASRVVRARLGVGDRELPAIVSRDGADNWFVRFAAGGPVNSANGERRARLVMEVSVSRAAFGGPLADAGWNDLLLVPPLPENVARDAEVVRAAIGVSRAQAPREAIAKLVRYFRDFVDSDAALARRSSVYVDLALSKKGVCRHRAFAFLVTALSLGIPTRLVQNEAHAWVEVHDGTMWRRIDLGGAGRVANPAVDALVDRTAYRAPPDAFSWPEKALRGDAMMADARANAALRGRDARGGSRSAAEGDAAPGETLPDESLPREPVGAQSGQGLAPMAGAPPGETPPGGSAATLTEEEGPPRSTITLAVGDAAPHRGTPLHVRGDVRWGDDPCPHVLVDLWLRAPAKKEDGVAHEGRSLLLGTVATRDDGTFADGIVVPSSTPLGDYDVVARTSGGARCAPGVSK